MQPPFLKAFLRIASSTISQRHCRDTALWAQSSYRCSKTKATSFIFSRNSHLMAWGGGIYTQHYYRIRLSVIPNWGNLYKKRTLVHCLMHQHAFVLCIIRIAQACLLHHFVCVDSITSSDKSCCYQLCNKYTFCLVERLYGCAIRDL